MAALLMYHLQISFLDCFTRKQINELNVYDHIPENIQLQYKSTPNKGLEDVIMRFSKNTN